MKLKGIGASDGIAMGKVYLFTKSEINVNQDKISEENVDSEINKIQTAIDDYIEELKNRKTDSEAAKEVTAAHIELSSDPALIDTSSDKIKNSLHNAELALQSTIDEMVSVFEMMEDEYLKERAADYRDIGENIMYKLKGIKPKTLSKLDDDYIIVSNELTPSDTSTMDKDHVLGLCMNLGGKTSHSSIIAQTLGIPAVVGMKNITENVENGEYIILDANQGIVIKNPDEETKKEYQEKYDLIKRDQKLSEKYKHEESITKDGREIEVVCNIGGIKDLELGLEDGARGVGLFRTEFLYMESNEFPSEERQFEVYKQAAQKLGDDKPLIIRTLDIGGDKGLDYFEFPEEENPFLGWRALRVQFDKVNILRDQLRAILRASAYGNVKILLPMIISVSEIQKVQEYLEEYKEELRNENIEFNEDIEVGIMIETPSSVFMAEELIQYCDFFSIGTNDLTQYVLASDRGNEKISHLYDNFNPAVLRAIKKVIDASHKYDKWTGMCGSMASDSLATYLLLGLGLDEFSSVGAKIGKIKSIINNSNYEEAKDFAEKILEEYDVEVIKELLKAKEDEFRL